jgi:excisionase family DNA binding protein
MGAATYQVSELAALLGVSEWAIYKAIKDGSSPVAPIRIGRRVVFSKASTDRLLGIDAEGDPA